MELSELGKPDGETAFETAEQRNYVRKSLVEFYKTAATRADILGDAVISAEFRLRQTEFSDTIE